jgi:SM-20-related protein
VDPDKSPDELANKESTLLCNPDNGEIHVHDGLVPKEIYGKLLQVSMKVGWRYGWNTPSNPEARYWHHEIGFGNKQNTESVAERVEAHQAPVFAEYQQWLLNHLPPGAKILRFYMNAHTYGTDGWPHTDTDRPGELSSILYLTGQWKPAWAGETVIFDDNGGIVKAVMPVTNRLLIFPADRLHAPRPLARACNGIRIVLVVKIGFEKGEEQNQEQ